MRKYLSCEPEKTSQLYFDWNICICLWMPLAIFFGSNTCLAESGDLSWFYQKFGDSTSYAETVLSLKENDLTAAQYEMLLEVVEENRQPYIAANVLKHSLYRYAYFKPDDPKYKKFLNRLYAPELLARLIPDQNGLYQFIPKEHLRNPELQEAAISQCNWLTVGSAPEAPNFVYSKVDLWQKLPADLVDDRALELLPCTLNMSFFVKQHKFSQTREFVLGYIEKLQGFTEHPFAYPLFAKQLRSMFQALPENIRYDRNFATKLIDAGVTVYSGLPISEKKKISNARVTLKNLVSMNIRFEDGEPGIEVTKFFPNDPDIVLNATSVTVHAENLKFASKKLRSDTKFMIRVLNHNNPDAYSYALEPAKSDRNVIVAAAIHKPEFFEKAPERVRRDIRVVEILVAKQPSIYRYSLPPAQTDSEVINRLFLTDIKQWDYVPEPQFSSIALSKLAAQIATDEVPCYIPAKLKKNKKVLLAMTSENLRCLLEVPSNIYDQDFQTILIRKSVTLEYLKFVPKVYRDDPNLIDNIIFDTPYGDEAYEFKQYITVKGIKSYLKKLGVRKFLTFYKNSIDAIMPGRSAVELTLHNGFDWSPFVLILDDESVWDLVISLGRKEKITCEEMNFLLETNTNYWSGRQKDLMKLTGCALGKNVLGAPPASKKE